MNNLLRYTLISCLVFIGFMGTSVAEVTEQKRVEAFSLSRGGLALKGYDPVSYFQGLPKKGLKEWSYSYKGVTYRFATEANFKAFKLLPDGYEPQYGGWCAWAIYDDGGRTEANPKSYRIVDGKLYLFYDGIFGDTLKWWTNRAAEQSEASMIKTADAYWNGQLTE